jgi:Ser/Thr protein kinase RdoA (MazF antagonist)
MIASPCWTDEASVHRDKQANRIIPELPIPQNMDRVRDLQKMGKLMRVRAFLAEHWGLADATVIAHHGGMGSATWFVAQDGYRWVAKAVGPAQRTQFTGGLRVAAALDAAGIPAGRPVPTRDGHMVVSLDGHTLALLTWVPGRPLTGAGRDEQQVIGDTLGRVHRALGDVRVVETQRFHWVRPAAAHLALRPWIRPAVQAAVAALQGLDPATLSWGLLHADPAPEHFRLDPASARCGLIDWSVALEGPLLYDLASAVMYVGGPEPGEHLVQAYLRRGELPAAEVERGLPVLLRFRWAVQADYFARRIIERDLTGVGGPADNEKGLEDARRWLARLGD